MSKKEYDPDTKKKNSRTFPFEEKEVTLRYRETKRSVSDFGWIRLAAYNGCFGSISHIQPSENKGRIRLHVKKLT